MAPPISGVGYLTVNDVLTDVSYALIEPPVNTSFQINTGFGLQTVATTDLAIYPGCLLVAGSGASLEVITVISSNRGVDFQASFANPHVAGEPIVGATFPVKQPLNPFFTQGEMLAYIAQAVNDFLVACPLVVDVNNSIQVLPTQQTASLPADCQKPVRIAAYGRTLRESSQTNLDMMDPRWNSQAPKGPVAYFRDKLAKLLFGIWPRANNTTPVEILYEKRGPVAVGLADGFIIPDPFLIYVKYRVLEFAYSKDGDQRNPGLARYYNSRYAFGVKLSNVLLEAVGDPNLDPAQ